VISFVQFIGIELIMDKNEQIKIEETFDSFVRSIGGVVLKDEISCSPSFENADYIFHNLQIVAELKCLEDNKLDDPVYMGKIDALWQKWRTFGLVKGDTPERILLSELPQQCARELISVTSLPLKGVVKKANRQIRQTKDNLDLSSYKGLLLLANDGNLAYPPPTLNQLVGGILSNGFTSIDCYVLFTVNMFAQVPGVDIPCTLWMPSYRSEAVSIPPDVMASLRDGWSTFQEQLIGQKFRRFGDVITTPI
jgi:hypothetical protein